MKHTDPGDDIRIHEDDLEVFETEHLSSCATVVMIDISHSMILYGEDRITPAKKVALALTELILTKYPKDAIDVLLFGDEATEVPISEIPYVQVGPYHTNTKAGLELAQRILRRRKHANKQIFMITDGKPSALYENGRLYTNSFGLDMKIVNRTLDLAVSPSTCLGLTRNRGVSDSAARSKPSPAGTAVLTRQRDSVPSGATRHPRFTSPSSSTMEANSG